MTTWPYNLNIPSAANNPSTDQPNMETNTNSISSLISVDHVGFSVANGGYHKDIHQLTNDPVPSLNTIYSRLYTPNTTGGAAATQLYTTNSAGAISQITGFLAGSDGWQWVGGILLQWGTVTFPGAPTQTRVTASITFKDRVAGAIPFPNSCFVVIGTPTNADTSSTAQSSLSIRTISNTAFTYLFNTTSGGGIAVYPGFYWVAIGN